MGGEKHPSLIPFSGIRASQGRDLLQPLEISPRQVGEGSSSFTVGYQVFIGVPENSSSLKNGSMTKVVTMYCGPFTIIKSIGDVDYKLDLSDHSTVYPMLMLVVYVSD